MGINLQRLSVRVYVDGRCIVSTCDFLFADGHDDISVAA